MPTRPRPGWENASACSQQRTRVEQIARRDWKEAERVAKDIPLGWFRAQALSRVAEVAPDGQVDRLLRDSIEFASKAGDEYLCTAVLAWVLEAAIARDRPAIVRSLIATAVGTAPSIEPLLSRAAALGLLLRHAGGLKFDEVIPLARALLDVAARLRAEPFARLRKWGTSHVNRCAYELSRVDAGRTEELLGEFLGAAEAAAVLKRHRAC